MSKKLEQIEVGQRVLYIPTHANKDRNHPDCRWGTVSGKNHKFAFVRYDEQVSKLGWDGATTQATRPEDLES